MQYEIPTLSKKRGKKRIHKSRSAEHSQRFIKQNVLRREHRKSSSYPIFVVQPIKSNGCKLRLRGLTIYYI